MAKSIITAFVAFVLMAVVAIVIVRRNQTSNDPVNQTLQAIEQEIDQINLDDFEDFSETELGYN